MEVGAEVRCVRMGGGGRCGGEMCEDGWWR